MSQGWCDTLGIAVPDLGEVVASQPKLTTYRRLVAALLERDAPMTLDEVAARFEAVGLGPAASSRRSLSRCRPATPPVVKLGERYGIDPRHEELRFLLPRLGLRVRPRIVSKPRPVAAPLPGPEVPLTPEELDQGWKDRSLHSWSQTRIALAVLDAHGGPLTPEEVGAWVTRRTGRPLPVGGAALGRKGSPVAVDEAGRLSIASGAESALRGMRKAVRVWVAQERARQAQRPDPAEVAARQARHAARMAERRRELETERRVLLVAFPPKDPEAVALLDVGARRVQTFVGAELAELPASVAGSAAVGAMDAYATLASLGLEGPWRVLELGPPKKTRRLNRSGRTLKITVDLLVRGTCGISRPFGDPKKLRAYLKQGHDSKLRRRLAADVKSLHALYAYGMLHGAVRLRWGFLDEGMAAPWKRIDDPGLYDLMRDAQQRGTVLEVVTGTAPGWSEPWARAQRARVVDDHGGPRLVDEEGWPIPTEEVQAVRRENTVT